MSVIKGSHANKIRNIMKISPYLVIVRVTFQFKGFRRFHLTALELDGFVASIGD